MKEGSGGSKIDRKQKISKSQGKKNSWEGAKKGSHGAHSNLFCNMIMAYMVNSTMYIWVVLRMLHIGVVGDVQCVEEGTETHMGSKSTNLVLTRKKGKEVMCSSFQPMITIDGMSHLSYRQSSQREVIMLARKSSKRFGAGF